jgi:Domain of unknown function (DUF4375)
VAPAGANPLGIVKSYRLARPCDRGMKSAPEMPPQLLVSFTEPTNGWMGLRLGTPRATYEARFSYVYPTLEQLCGALCDVVSGVPTRRVTFLLEPAELELVISSGEGEHAEIILDLFDDRRRYPDARRSRVFTFTATRPLIVVPFWRALRTLRARLPPPAFQEAWRGAFPDREMASFTQLLQERWGPASTVMGPTEELREIAIPLIDRVGSAGLSVLNPSEKAVYLVWCFVANVNNGGFSAFFYNSPGEYAAETVESLRSVGCENVGDELQSVMALFPNSVVPADLEERNRAWNELPAHQRAKVVDAADAAYFKFGSKTLFQRTWEYVLRGKVR